PELGRDQARHRLHAGLPLPGGEDGRRDHPQRQCHQDHDGQRPADARSDDPLPRDGHQAPYGGARVQADRGARDRGLSAERGRVAVRRRREVHPRGHPGRARQGEPGPGHARQVPHAPGSGLDEAHRARVRGGRDAARRADGAAALGARDAHGGRDRALHRRARLRGSADRDAAGGDDGGHGVRKGRAGARLPVRLLGRGFRRGTRGDRSARPPGPARLRSAGRAARLRPQVEHARLPGLAARLPRARAHPATAQDRGCRDRRRVRRSRRAARGHRRRARGGRGSWGDQSEGHSRGPAPAAGDQPRRSLPADLKTGRAQRAAETKENTIPPQATQDEVLEDEIEVTREVEFIEFELGDHVVYPHHGAGKVLKKEEMEMLGERREYLTIKILHNDMTVRVPTENAALAGLRRVIDEETVKKVLDVLRDEVSEMPKNWNRRFKHNRDKIKTGDIYELAEVVRNLSLRESEKGLSTGEKQMFTRTKKILASELMYALDKDEEEAESYLDELLAASASSQLAGAAAD